MATHGKGTGTFMRQRITALANIPLILFFIWLVVSLAGAERAQMADAFSNPFVAIATLALLASALVHMRIGMIEVIADYIHTPRTHRLCLTLNTVFTVALGVIGALSVLVLAFGG